MKIIHTILAVIWYISNCALAVTITFTLLFAYVCNGTGDAYICATGIEAFWLAWIPYSVGFIIMVPKDLIEEYILKEKR